MSEHTIIKLRELLESDAVTRRMYRKWQADPDDKQLLAKLRKEVERKAEPLGDDYTRMFIKELNELSQFKLVPGKEFSMYRSDVMDGTPDTYLLYTSSIVRQSLGNPVFWCNLDIRFGIDGSVSHRVQFPYRQRAQERTVWVPIKQAALRVFKSPEHTPRG